MFKRLFTLIVCTLIMSCNLGFLIVKAEEKPELYSIPIISNEINQKFIVGYLYGNELFVSVDGICKLTRSTCEISNQQVKIVQGIREIKIDLEQNKIKFGNQTTEFIVKRYNNKILVKPHAILNLLCANLNYNKINNSLFILMPSITIYEAMQPKLYSKCHYYIYDNDEFNTIVRMSASCFSDLVFDGYGNFFNKIPDILSFHGADSYIDNALIEISKVDIYSYNILEKSINNNLTKRTETIDSLKNISDYAENINSISSVYTDILKDVIGNSDIFLNALVKEISFTNDVVDWLSVAKSTEEKLNYNIDSFKLIGKVLTQQNIGEIQNSDTLIKRADFVSDTLSSKVSAYLNATEEQLENKLYDTTIKALSENTNMTNIGNSTPINELSLFLMAFDVGANVTKVLMKDEFQAWDSDINAIVISDIQNIMFDVIKQSYNMNESEGFSNYEHVKNLIDSINLYNRITIAMFSNLKKSNDEFHMYEKSFSDTWDSLCGESAENSYNLYSCNLERDICSLDEFKDNYNNDIAGLIDIESCEKYNDTLVVPVEDETQSTEFVEITEAETTMQTEESAPTIPEEASIYNGHSYVVYPESMTWQEAKEYCEKLGGHLVTISDADEQKFVEELAENCTDKVSYWLGGYYSDSEWKWVDDTEFSYTNWDSWTDGKKEYRQPDNFYGDEYYLRFANKDFTYTDWKSNKGKWNDVSNEADGTNGDVPLDSFGVICEWDYEQSDKSKDKIGEIIIEDGYLNVRDKPSTKGKVIGKLNNQDTVKIISEKDNWYEIEFDGKNGYVSSDYIKLIDNKSNNTSDEKGKEVDSGKCGDNLTWSLDSNGLLTIEGKGKMYNYKYSPYDDGANRPPWQFKKIKSLVIKSGVTSIGNHAFNRQDNLSSISIADTVTSIGKEAFFSCDSLGYLFQIPENISSIGESAFSLCCNTRLLYVGKNATNIEKYSLDSTYLLTIYGYNGTEAQIYAQNNNIPFVCVDDDYGYHGNVSNKNGASFKANASKKAEEITVIPYDTEISEYDSIGDWALVKYNGKLGYVHKDDLHFEGGFAKPVIYLYTEKKQDISVKIKFKNGDFTCTYPEYNNGWNVTAYPNGRLINKSDNDEYSYLYWEGEGAIQYDFSSGFVVKSEDTAKFLKETLSYMGLTPKEYNEFIVYWLPIMQKNEYNLISFQTDNYEESAKLEISPKPDSMLRVFMAFKEVDENTVVPEQKLETFKRNGFTVIEWGGTEVK